MRALMETWGSWTFSKENENLLAEVLNKFATDQHSGLDDPIKVILSSLATSSKTRVETTLSSSSCSDDSDVDGDFNAVQTRSPGFRHRAAATTRDDDLPAAEPAAEIVDGEGRENAEISMANAFDDYSSLLSQSVVVNDDRDENVTKVIVELLNGGHFDARKLCSLLEAERRIRKDVTEIIRDVWPEIITDKARHDLCEALVKTDVRPHIVCEHVYMPWFKTCESNLTGFIDSLSKMIVHFPEYACKSFLAELLKDKESILVKHVDWLDEIMKSLDRRYWCSLLSEYTKCCSDCLDRREIPVVSHLVKNCQDNLNVDEAESLIALCRNAAHEHCANRDFVALLVAVIGAVDLARFRPEITAIYGQLKGASKFQITKALKNAK